MGGFQSLHPCPEKCRINQGYPSDDFTINIEEAGDPIVYRLSFSESIGALDGTMLGYPATETSQSAFSGWNANDDLVELFANADPNGTDTTSFYTITPAGTPSDVFTLSLAFGTASFNGLATNPAGLKVFANLISDTAGNNLPADVEDDEQYAINYFDFKIDGASFVLGGGSPTQSTVADATMDLNMLDFIEQESFQQVPTFGFVFTFSKELNTSSVSIDDFSINLGKQTITYSIGGSTTSEIYDFSDPANSDISFNNTNDQITLAFKLTESMQKYGFDLNGDLSVQINSNSSEILDNENGSKVGSDSPTLSYQIKSKMPRLTSFELEQATNSYTTGSISTNYYSTFAGADASNDPVTFYGYKLKLSFDEEVESLISTSSISEYSDAAHTGGVAYYTSRQFLEYGSDYAIGYTLPNTTSDEYTNYFPGTRSLFTNPISAASTIWYFYAYLTPDTADFTNNVSEHNYTLLYDATGVSLSGNTDYPHLLRASSNLYLVDADGNPVRVPDSWLLGGSNHGLLSLDVDYDSQPPELIGASALNVDDLDNDGVADDYNGTYGTYGDTATFAFELTFSEEVGNNTELSAAINWNVTSGTTISSSVADVSGPVVANDQYVYTLSNEVSGLFDASGNSGQYSISFNGNDLVDTVGNAVDTSAANAVLARDLCVSGFCSYENAYVGLVSASANPSSQLVNPATGTESAANITFTLVFSEPVTLTQSDPSSIFSLTFYEALTGDQVGNAINLNDTFPSFANVDDVGDGYAYTYTLSVEDGDTSDDYLWALFEYDNLFNTATDTELNLLLLDSIVEANSGFNFLTAFHSAQDVYPVVPATIQSEFVASADPSSSVGVYFLDGIPEVDSAEAVAANSTNSQNYNSSDPVKRHVAFTFSGFNASTGDGFGMHMLFRTSDAAFTQDDPSTAPYYGAEGGIYISGQQLDQDNVGYHICPPFNKHINRAGVGVQHPNLTHTYNENIVQIHYLAIPYDAVSASHLYDDTEIAAIPIETVSFDDALAVTEPCVRTAFYNDGVGQYGYVVDSDMEEQHMVIANAMLQDQSGDSSDLAMLDPAHLDNVYFDLYSKDYYNDSWRRDQRITAEDLLADLSANLSSSTLHDADDGIAFQIDQDHLSIFASRFVNSINARFLDSVIFDSFNYSDVPITTAGSADNYEDVIADHYNSFEYDTSEDYSASYSSGLNNLFIPDLTNANPDALAPINDNRLVLSIGVHPSAISVDAGSGYFQPFESNQASFLKMDPEFYDLYYGGDSSTSTEPGLDYTSRHLAYVNFDLVYELDIDDKTEAITGATLVEIVSPFSLLKHSFFSAEELQARRAGGETYSAVAASIADNVFRHNFTGTTSSSKIQHFLPYGLYCYQPTIDPTSSCYNSQAQMLLPDPDDTGNHSRTVASHHNLHRGVMYFNDINNYSASISTYDSANDPNLLSRFIRLHEYTEYAQDANGLFGSATYIGDQAYSSMLYNSFDRAYGADYTPSASSENFASGATAPDGLYTTDALEQAFWAVSPFSESPDARADQILPNAFFLGNQDMDFMFNFIVKPYQYTGFTQQVQSALADPEYLINKNIHMRFIGIDAGNGQREADAVSDGLNFRPSFTMPPSAFVSGLVAYSTDNEHITGSVLDMYSTYGGNNNRIANKNMVSDFREYPFYVSHIIPHSSPQLRSILLDYDTDEWYYYSSGYTSSRYYLQFQYYYQPYLAGRIPGFFADTIADTAYGRGTYALTDNTGMYTANGPRSTSYGRIQYDLTYGGFVPVRNPGGTYSSQIDGDGFHTIAGIVHSSSIYDIGRSSLPHHEDDFDFDRGQISSHKLGFHLDGGEIFDYDTSLSSSTAYSFKYNSMFFPTNPALVTSYTQSSDTIAIPFDGGDIYHGIGEVDSYYPAVQSQESLYTELASTNTASASTVAFESYPTMIVHIGNPQEFKTSNFSNERAYNVDGRSMTAFHPRNSATNFNTYAYYSTTRSYVKRTIPLDKIFPEGYSYQLGFINREELFMYDPEWIASGSSGTPEISRFYASSVGNFGYATQYSRLNRRAMQKYHMNTSSQFLGDHLARFSTTPTAGVQTPTDITAVFAHTPAQQGGRPTAYGSYAAGYYDVETSASAPSESSVPHSNRFQSRWVSGTLRGYVLELRTSPLTDDDNPGRLATTGESSDDAVSTRMLHLVQDLGGVHPED